MKSTGTETSLKTAWHHAHYSARCGVLGFLTSRPAAGSQAETRKGNFFFFENKKEHCNWKGEDESEETSPHNGQGDEPAPRQCALRAWLHGGRVGSNGGVNQRCVGPRRPQEGRSVRGWCWLPGALILRAACTGLRYHHRDTGGAPAPECRPSGVGSLLPLPPPLLARARARSLSLSRPPMSQIVPPPSCPGPSPEGTQPDEATDCPLFLCSCAA